MQLSAEIQVKPRSAVVVSALVAALGNSWGVYPQVVRLPVVAIGRDPRANQQWFPA